MPAIAAAFPELAAEFERTQKGVLKAGWEKAIPSFPTDKAVATRNAGGVILNAIAGASAGDVWRGRGFDFIDEDDL